MDVVTFALLGIGVGAIYGIVAQGLVLVYRGSGILNFAQSGFLMVGGYLFYEFYVNWQWPYFAAMAVAVLICAAIGAAVHLFILRPMRRASAVARLIATLGVMGVITAIVNIIFKGNTESVPSSLSLSSITILPGVHIGVDIVILFGIGLAITLALWLFYRFTPFGRMTTAVAENHLVVSVTGHSPDVVASVNWAIGAALAGVAGILIAPIDYLQSGTLALLIIPAIGAALLGSFLSFPLALVGGLILGMAQSVASLYITTPGWSLSVPYLLIIAYLLVRGRALPLRSFVIDRLPKVGSGRVKPIPIAIVTLATALVLAFTSPTWSTAITVTIAFAVITLSVVVITGYAGQLSLAQYVVAGVGALTAARLSANWHVPFLLAIVGGMIVTAATGAALAVPSLRSRGISLAVATLAAGMVIFDLVLNNFSLSGGENGISQRPPTLFGWDINPSTHPSRYGVTVLVILVILCLGVCNIRRGASGRRMLAVRTNERAAAALGVNVYGAKVYAFTVAAAVAGAGGVLYAFVSPTVLSGNFDLLTSINFVTVTVLGGVGNIGGAVIGSSAIPGGIVSQILFNVQQINAWIPLVGSVGLLLVLRRHSSGLFELNRELFEKVKSVVSRSVGGRPSEKTTAVAGEGNPEVDETLLTLEPVRNDNGHSRRVEPKTLEVTDLRVTFGGVVAVNDVNLAVRPGEVHGLIGPNGAGKTTFIDAVTGFVKAKTGTIKVGQTEVTGWSVQRRARLGIARSFQSLELFGDLTVRENLAVACDDGRRTRYITDIFRPGKITLGALVEETLRDSGLDEVLDSTPDSLSFGTRRLIAIMRALASEPSVLLLDEPAAGLSDSESRELGVLIRSLAEKNGIAILLVEHNLDVVTAVSDRMTVLSSGGVLAQGTPDEVLINQDVLDTYVGELVQEVRV